jgi:hypothetical protein
MVHRLDTVMDGLVGTDAKVELDPGVSPLSRREVPLLPGPEDPPQDLHVPLRHRPLRQAGGSSGFKATLGGSGRVASPYPNTLASPPISEELRMRLKTAWHPSHPSVECPVASCPDP